MRRTPMVVVVTAVLSFALAGCTVRSISDSGYGDTGPRHASGLYRGELSEFDVLGIERGRAIAEEEIRGAIDSRLAMVVKRGASVMLIQSGALIPDDVMVTALRHHYRIGVFSGIPPQVVQSAAGVHRPETYARSLRLAAARGGYEKIVVYWGLLETAQENLVTKTVSWVPVAGWVIPDQRQRMRIRLKVAVVDVRSGQWEMFSPDAFEDEAYAGIITRRGSDQAQVALLKDRAYSSAAEELVRRYGR